MLENLYVHFPRNEKAFKAIRDHHAHAKFANEPEGLLIQGECGTGKTTIVKLDMKNYPRIHTQEITRVPVLYAKVPVPATCKNLNRAAIKFEKKIFAD